ncbi:MAG: nicotinate (nicotinamide) nucleotide adenylyltransferase [Candidatus Obscuribacterales bacterium]|nr:nicotinate (nicotinamide) nucleotide adenylyltransferase [Candidatus Obscuribacterales bacterium]
MARIGVFGGTFNPFHLAELNLGRTVVKQFPLDKLLYIPNGEPPHKKTGVLDKELRYEMVVAGLVGESKLEASRIEIDRPGTTWTIDTLRELKKLYGDQTQLDFIMGADNVPKFANYYLSGDFFKLCNLLIGPRLVDKSVTDSDIIAKPTREWVQKLLPTANFELIDIEPSSQSSTEIRDKISRGESIAHLVAPAVLKIIETKGHYKKETA